MTTYPATYCPDCGAALGTRAIAGRERKWCGDCERVVWHTPTPTAGVAVVGDDGVLLTRRAIEPGIGKWSVPGGHLEADEPPEVAGARELAEETGVRVDPADLTLLDTFFSDHGTGKTIVSIGYVAPRSATAGEPTAGDEVTEIGWFTPETFKTAEEVYLGAHGERFERAWGWYREHDG